MTSPSAAALVGRTETLRTLTAALDAGRHVLVEGPHGVGKSRLVTEYCRSLGATPLVVHGSAGLTSAGLTGIHDPAVVLQHGYRADSFLPGPLVESMAAGRVLVLDEANRVPADVINTLITAMSDGELAVPRYGRVVAAPGFRIIASINPLDNFGTGSLPAAFLDRVVRLVLGYQCAEDELAIIRSQVPDAEEALRVKALFVARASRRHPDVSLGASVRGAVDLVAIVSQLKQLRAADPGLEAALLAFSSKIHVRPGLERSVESVIRDLWADAVIAEHRAVGTPDHGGGALPESSLYMDRESADDRELAATSAPGTEAVPGHDKSAKSAAGSGGGAGTSLNRSESSGTADSDVANETLDALTSFVKSSPSGGGHRQLSHVDGESAPDVERIAAGIIVRRTQGRLPVERRQGGRFATVRYNFRSDDLDIDKTVGELLDNPVPTHAQLWVHDRVPKRRGVVLMLDVSGSMRGGRAIESATAAAAATLATEQDELAVIAFGSEAEVLKGSDERLGPSEVVHRVLSIRPQGLTNLSAGLDAGRAQLTQMRAQVKVAVLMTDGVQNEGPDASISAARFPLLNVLATTDSVWRLRHCRLLASAGRGRCMGYESVDQLPGVLSTLLTV